VKTFALKVVTPNHEVFNGEAEHVRLPGAEGFFGVWAGHAPLLSILEIGAANFRSAGAERTLAITGGYAEVLGDTVTVIARSAEFVEEIDVARAEISRKRALERLSAHEPGIDGHRAQAAIRRALLRLSLADIRPRR